MAKSEDGIFGTLSGKLGNVIISSWKGIPYLRARPAQNTSNTPAQQKQRNKFGVVIHFVNAIRPVINAGFKHNIERMTELNSATSYLMKRAVVMDEGEPRLHYPSVLVARGDLPTPPAATAELAEEGVIFRWTYDEDQPGASGNDRLIALAFDPSAGRGAYYAGGGEVCREDESFTLTISAFPDVLETYLAFASADGHHACNSLYLGRFTK